MCFQLAMYQQGAVAEEGRGSRGSKKRKTGKEKGIKDRRGEGGKKEAKEDK